VHRLISVLRRPTGIVALISAPAGARDQGPYRDEIQPLSATSLAICPWRDKDVKAWRALGRVDTLTPRAALAIIRSLIGSVTDPDAQVADLGTPDFSGPIDLRPYLCSPASEQQLIDQMGDVLEAATGSIGFPDWHWRRRLELAALPAGFRRHFLWGLHLSGWETVEATLAIYQQLDLDADLALRRLVARMLSLADRPAGLDGARRIAGLAPAERLAAAAAILAAPPA